MSTADSESSKSRPKRVQATAKPDRPELIEPQAKYCGDEPDLLLPFRVAISDAMDFSGPSPPDVPDWKDPTPHTRRVGITLDFDPSRTKLDITKSKSPTILVNNAFLPVHIRVSSKPPFYDLMATGSRTTSETDVRFEPEYDTELHNNTGTKLMIMLILITSMRFPLSLSLTAFRCQKLQSLFSASPTCLPSSNPLGEI